MLNLHYLLPELYISASVLGRLVASSVVLTTFTKTSADDLKHRSAWSRRLTRTLALAFVLTLPLLIETTTWFAHTPLWTSDVLWYGTLTASFATQIVKLVLVARTAAVILGTESITTAQGIRAPEYVMMMAFASIGLLFLSCANDLISLFIALEWQSLLLYVLASFRRASAYSTEAGLKYFIQGSVMTAVYLLGAALLYGTNGTVNFTELYPRIISETRLTTNTTALTSSLDFMNLLWATSEPALLLGNLVGMMLIASAILFKLAAVPFHSWAPDVYEGSPTSSAIYFAVVPKIAQVALLVRLCTAFEDILYLWQTALIAVSIASMSLAPFSALAQMKWKRFLAFSSIANVGNLLLALSVGGFHGVQATWLYVIIYGLSVLRVWLSLASLVKIEHTLTPTSLYVERPLKYIHELGSLVKTNTVLAYTIAAAILASAGLPPFVMFQAKLSVILAAVSAHHSLLALYMVLISVLTTFYYLRFVKILFFTTDESSDRTVKGAMTPLIATIISLLSILMLLLMMDSNMRTGVTTWMTTSSGLVH